MSNFWFGYWWPSIKGNGPEDLTSLVIVGVVTAIFVPKVRAWWIAREKAVHEKLDQSIKLSKHLIKHHPDIPNEDHNGNPLV